MNAPALKPRHGPASSQRVLLCRERKRRQRERDRRGERVVPAVVNDALVGFLIDHGWLAISESEDAREIGAALVAAIGSAMSRVP